MSVPLLRSQPNRHASFGWNWQPGDVLIDGGNEWFPNSIRRSQALEPKVRQAGGPRGTGRSLRADQHV